VVANTKEVLVKLFEQLIPFNRMLGVRVLHVDHGNCTVHLPWRDEFIGDPARPALHGGITSTLCDASGGLSCFSTLAQTSDRVSTIDLRVDYLLPGPTADVFCRSSVVRMGSRVAVTRMEVFSGSLPQPGEGQPIATAQGVYNILRRSGGKPSS